MFFHADPELERIEKSISFWEKSVKDDELELSETANETNNVNRNVTISMLRLGKSCLSLSLPQRGNYLVHIDLVFLPSFLASFLAPLSLFLSSLPWFYHFSQLTNGLNLANTDKIGTNRSCKTEGA